MAKKLKKTRLQKLYPVFKTFLLAIAVIYVSFFAYSFNESYRIEIKKKSSPTVEEQVEEVTEHVTNLTQPRRPKYWFYMSRGYMWIFYSVENVLQRLGLEKIEMKIENGKMLHMDWDLLWSYDYHNEIPIDFDKLQYHQRINHIPGNFLLTMKDYFALNTDSKYVPKAFNDTEKLKEYAAKYPEKRFVQKLWSNRGISLRKVEEMSFKMFGPGYKYFGQEYIENPLLIDGFKFDFGIYVVITSINPLRIYYYQKNTLIRLCAVKYDRTNYTNVDSYVISDTCQFPWDLDALSMYYNRSYTYKEAMNAYLSKNGYNVSKIWTQVEDCIREVVVPKEKEFNYWATRYPYKHSFFELYRFDFILDSDLNLYLIEVNQSPNVNPSALLYRDQRLFENLLYNVFTLVGVGHYMPKPDFKFGNEEVEAMVCHEEGLTVLPEICVNSSCNKTCDEEICALCHQCMTNNQKHELHLIYREAKNRGAFKRIFPPSKDELESFGSEYLNSLEKKSQWQALWFLEMCKKDADFC